jgi:hypothetical protein
MEWRVFLGAGLLAGVVLFSVGGLFHFLVPLIAPSLGQEYRNEELFRPWAGGTAVYMAVHPFLYGLIFAAIFLAVRARVGAENLGGVTDGLAYGVVVFVGGSLPVFALNYASFRVSLGVIVSWAIQSLCQYAAAGSMVGWYSGRTGG